MRVNIYSQELTEEVIRIEKFSNTGKLYVGAQLILHSSHFLHHPPADDDRSAVTFWLPSSAKRNILLSNAFQKIASIFHIESERIRQFELSPQASK